MAWITIEKKLGIRAEDRRKLWLMTPIFLVCGIAEILNYNGFMTLFNQRLGASYLPYVYMAEAVILPFEAWAMSRLAGKLSKASLMRLMYAALVAIVAANAAVLLAFRGAGWDFRFYYAILFITSNFVVRQQTILLWSLAVDVCPTHQAKRLMPVFVSGATLGGVIGGLATQAVSPLGADIVYAIGPLLLAAVAFNYRKVIARFLVPLTLQSVQTQEEEGSNSSFSYFRGTFRSPFLLGVLGMMSIMPALYFLIEYVFMNTAHARYPDEASFARMFGVVSTLLFTLAFLLQLVSGKLTAKLGASGMLVGIAAVYAISFAAAFALFDTPLVMVAVSGAYMLTNVLVYYSAEPSYQLFYKTLPLHMRDGYRFAAQGLSSFLGIVLGSGMQLLHSGLGWSFPSLAVVGACVSAAMLALSWVVRQLYIRSLVGSVRAIGAEEREQADSLRELARSPRAMGAVLAMLRLPDEEAREIALDILAAVDDPRYLPDVLERLGDGSPRVRLAALRALNLTGAELDAMIKVAQVLEDEDPDVRAVAVRKLAQMKHMPEKAFFFLRLKLMDPRPEVVAEAVKAMYLLENEVSYAACYEVIERILGEGGEQAVPICRVAAELELVRFAPQVLELLHDPHPSVRVAATACLGALRRLEAIPLLLERLPTADQELCRVTVRALTEMGEGATNPLRGCLPEAQPKTWQAAVTVLAALLPEEETRGWLAEQAANRLEAAEEEAVYPQAFAAVGRPELAELAALRSRELAAIAEEAAWSVMGRLADEQVASSVRQAIAAEDEDVRGSGLEVLAEGLGERKLSQKLAAFLQREADPAGDVPPERALELLADAARSADDWWRELAAEAGKGRSGFAAGETHEWRSEIAASSASGKERTDVADEPNVLGRLSKVVYLKKVPFFADLSLEELGLIAGAAREMTFPDGARLLNRGEKNEAMYVIVSGNVELSSVSAAGWEATLGVIGPGEVCGATSALDGSPSTVTAQAFFGEVKVLTLRQQEVTRLVRLYPEIGLGLLRASLVRVRTLEEMIMRIDS
ncbi:HEAT repeat domain-containing protein [Cohnella zeiphila]|uniref:HEAT repeat domain-containing protein n=1 Tax=Cohnella zeiphila TaxID=2761120 RepID=A0A7X0ST16_9BACL|nr:HEAT repeat domain-containing protein [Cohnella zeiphila]MBB6735590.1 HEAT repeat domain-containing protein [Cohnella zeiphila]